MTRREAPLSQSLCRRRIKPQLRRVRATRNRQDLPVPQHFLLRPRFIRGKGHAGEPVYQSEYRQGGPGRDAEAVVFDDC